jgi:hypothetical protein
MGAAAAWVDLYWLPLGAGGHVVKWNGRVYEAITARRDRRPRSELYHAALEVQHDGGRYVIEMAPVWNESAPERGVVCEGPVWSRRLGRLRAFRYEVRCWRDGRIPDVSEAVDSPRRVTDDPVRVAALHELLPLVPPLVWGRDELAVGDMWNSNSLVAWLLAGAGLDVGTIGPPEGGRAPGWRAGLALAAVEHKWADPLRR